MYISPGVVIGFHGGEEAVFDRVIKHGAAISGNENDYDWLGHGIYFWEGNYECAMQWAKQDNGMAKPSVIGTLINLGNCIDLLDTDDLQQVESMYKILAAKCNHLGEHLPENKVHVEGISFVRELDCKVISRLQPLNNDTIAADLNLVEMNGQNKRQIQNHPPFFDSARGVFP
jgi:hypothetical protein